MKYRHRRRLIQDLVSFGRVRARTQRALHNDHDYDCVHWWGDRRLEKDDDENRALDGQEVWISDRRCLVCRPLTDDEAQTLLDPTSREVIGIEYGLLAEIRERRALSDGSTSVHSTHTSRP